MLSVSVPVGSEWWEEEDGQGCSGTLQTAVNYSKMFCIKEEHSKEKEGKNTTHSINQKDALLGYSLLGKALIYQRQEKNPTKIGKSRDDCEAQGWCRTITAGCMLSLQKNALKDCLLLLKGINAQGRKYQGHFDSLELKKLCSNTPKKKKVILILGGLKFMKVQRSHLSMHLNNESWISCSKDPISFSTAASSLSP